VAISALFNVMQAAVNRLIKMAALKNAKKIDLIVVTNVSRYAILVKVVNSFLVKHKY
jgi:ABC-type uncharacterized transport system permease subunit